MKRGFSEAKIGSLSGLIVEELRKGLDTERAARAEAMFKADVAAGRIQFRLRLDGKIWRMPFTVETNEPETARQLVGKSGGPLERSLFASVYENEFNDDERDVAVYLDGEKALVVAPQCGARSIWDAGLATGENLSRLYLCRGAFRQFAAVYGAGNEGRSARQFGHGLQARHAQFPVRECRMGHDGSGWNSGTDQSDRRNGRVLIDPDE